MLRQGVHPKIVQERLGHSSIAITLDTYSHVTPGLQEAAALKFDEELAETVPVSGSVDKTQTVPLTNRRLGKNSGPRVFPTRPFIMG